MPDLRQSTSVDVRIGAAMDANDGVTPETTLTLGAADQAELLKHNGAATVDISGRTFAAVAGSDGWYNLTLTAADTDTAGDLTIVIQDSSLHTPIWRHCSVISQGHYDAKYGVADMPVTVVEVQASAAADVRAAVGLATANLDTQFAAIPTAAENRAEMDSNSTQLAAIDTEIAALNDPTAATIASQVWATVCESQGSFTAQQIMSILLSILSGQTSNGGATFSTPNGGAQRVAATLDASNNRTAMSVTPSA
ncbi:MAG: hypothetical protein KZQ95_01790 [Candidatus Thiodiazotropha sp. (ex Epidulcina cf. delphinae)]|nr:hypothetical protein [Candidatus Thiodiazotropha sp. (ex Epidulcina cf. delphinae)]